LEREHKLRVRACLQRLCEAERQPRAPGVDLAPGLGLEPAAPVEERGGADGEARRGVEDERGGGVCGAQADGDEAVESAPGEVRAQGDGVVQRDDVRREARLGVGRGVWLERGGRRRGARGCGHGGRGTAGASSWPLRPICIGY
jgi:hypothetical protein